MGKKYQFPFGLVLGLIALSTIFQLCASNLVANECFKESFGWTWIVSGYEGALKYATMRDLNNSFTLKGRFVVLQFEIRLEKGLECGGADLKYPNPQHGGWKPDKFDNKSLYSIMFGIDKCGSNKVRFILKQKNPRSGEYVEHHLKFPPTAPFDKLSHVYTAILKPNNDLVFLIDGKQKKHASFLNGDDFEPPLIPAKTISNTNDKKPEDWDEQDQIPDLEAVKPGHCETLKSKSPIRESVLGWCERENPRNVRNLAHRGKWHSPPIDNSNYNGARKAKEIPNPDYYVLDKPYIENTAAVGTKSCTTGDGIKKKILDLLSKLFEFLKMFKYKAELTWRSQTAIISVTICYNQFCFFTWTYEIR